MARAAALISPLASALFCPTYGAHFISTIYFLIQFNLRRRLLPGLVLIGVLVNVILVVGVYIFAPTAVQRGIVKGLGPESINLLLNSIVYWPNALLDQVQPSGIIKLLAVIYTGLVTGQAYNCHVVHHLSSIGISRIQLAIARMIALLLPLGLIVLVPLVFGLLLTAILTLIAHKPLDVTPGFLLLALSLVSRSIVAYLPYICLSFLIAILTKKSVVAIVWVIALMTFIEPPLYFASNAVGFPLDVFYGLIPSGLQTQ